MSVPIPAWGSGPWGSFSWGGGVGAGTISVDLIEAIRENVVRITFNTPVYFSGLLDVPDASKTVNYTITAVSGTGLDGEPIRPVTVVEVRLFEPNIVDLVLDRPMTPFPAIYLATVSNVFSLDLMSAIPVTERQFQGLFQNLTPPSVDTSSPSRDVANAQTGLNVDGNSPDPLNPFNLGAFALDDTGDYAGEEGLVALKNRIYRRLATRKGAFAHLPEYGIGVKDYGKRLATSAAINSLVSNTEAQIAREPEVQFVRVRPILDNLEVGLLRLRIAVRTKTGKATAFDAPFVTTS